MDTKPDSSRDGSEPSSVTVSPVETASPGAGPRSVMLRKHENATVSAAMRPHDLPAWVRHVQDMGPEQVGAMQAAGQWEKVGVCLAGLLKHDNPDVRAKAIRLQVAMAKAETERIAVINEAARIEADRGGSSAGGATVTREMIWREVHHARSQDPAE